MDPRRYRGVIALLLADMPGGAAWTRMTDQGNRDSASQTIDRYLEPTAQRAGYKRGVTRGKYSASSGTTSRRSPFRVGRETYAVGHYRPETAAVLVNNRGISFNLDDIQGYNPVQIRRYVTYFRYLNNQSQSYHTSNVLENGIDSPLLNMLNVRYIVAPAQIPPGRPDLIHLMQRYRTVYLDDTSRILENPDALPRTWIVHEAVKTRTGQILPQFVDASVDPGSDGAD